MMTEFVDTKTGYTLAEIHAASVNGGWIVTAPQPIEGCPGQSRTVKLAGPFLRYEQAEAWIESHRHTT